MAQPMVLSGERPLGCTPASTLWLCDRVQFSFSPHDAGTGPTYATERPRTENEQEYKGRIELTLSTRVKPCGWILGGCRMR